MLLPPTNAGFLRYFSIPLLVSNSLRFIPQNKKYTLYSSNHIRFAQYTPIKKNVKFLIQNSNHVRDLWIRQKSRQFIHKIIYFTFQKSQIIAQSFKCVPKHVQKLHTTSKSLDAIQNFNRNKIALSVVRGFYKIKWFSHKLCALFIRAHTNTQYPENKVVFE